MNDGRRESATTTWMFRCLLAAMLLWGLPTPPGRVSGAASGELFASPGGSGNDCTRTDPCTLSTALGIAQANGLDDVITLAPGTYASANYAYAADDGMSLTLRGRPGALPDEVILDGGGSGTPLHLQSFGATSSVIVMGLTIQGGTGSGMHVYCDDGRLDVTLDRVTIRNNSAHTDGGGINIEASPSYMNSGNATAVVEIRDSLIQGNRAGKRGGGVKAHSGYGDSLVELRLVNTLVHGTQAMWSGGGIDLAANEIGDNNALRAIVVGSTITDNVADVAGTGSEIGGGVHAYAYSGLGAAVTLDLYNSIVYGNRLSSGAQQDVSLGEWGGDWGRGNTVVNAHHCDIGNVQVNDSRSSPDYNPDSVISANPRFREPTAGDYRLQPISPCIDRGTHAVPTPPGLPTADLDGEPRVSGAAPDLGAYEVQLESVYLPAVLRG